MYQTVDQIANEYSKHPMYIRKLARQGILEAVKVNGSWMIVADSAARYFGRSSRSTSSVAQPQNVVASVVSQRTFGVEIELVGLTHYQVTEALQAAGLAVTDEYGNYNHETRRAWKVMRDRSINGTGCEVVSPVLKGEAGMVALEKVCNTLKAAGAKINKSCGLHVHLGIDDLNVDSVKNLIHAYSRNQAVINSFLAHSRHENYYCRAFTDADLVRLSNCNTIEQMSNVVTSRYFNVNLQAYTRHGTVEFRQHQGSVEFSKISNWVTFLMALVDNSKVNRLTAHETVQDLVSALNLSETVQRYFVDRARHFAHA